MPKHAHHSVSLQSVSYFTVPPRASLIRQMPDRTDAVRWQSAGRSPSPAPFPRRDNAFSAEPYYNALFYRGRQSRAA